MPDLQPNVLNPTGSCINDTMAINKPIYLDNAATSWPKPPEVLEAMKLFLQNVGANPGRAGHHLANESAGIVYDAREAIAELFGEKNPLRVIFGANVTEALNLALSGYLRPGDHVITSSIEHNSVMRPLRFLEESGVELTIVSCSPQGILDPEDIRRAIRPNTRMVVINHASNVMGTILPIEKIGSIARESGLLFCVDTAQTAGAVPFNINNSHIDLLAFTGHKALYGPPGTGGLIIGERVHLDRLNPQKRGGTGSRSEDEIQPDFLPDRYESGTQNTVGLAGLNAGVRWILGQGVDTIRAHEIKLTSLLVQELEKIPGVSIQGTGNASLQTATVSFTLENCSPSSAALSLDDDSAILCRVGLHCSPAAHRTMGTFPEGTIRFGMGMFTTEDEIRKATKAVAKLAGEGR